MRLLRTYIWARREVPKFSDDDVIDFQVLEALMTRDNIETKEAQEEAQKAAERKRGGVAGHREESFLERARAQG